MSGPVSSRLAGVERRLSTIGNQVALVAAQAVADGVTAEVGAAGGGLSRYRRGDGPPRVEAHQRGANSAEVVPTSGVGQLAIMQKGAKGHRIGERGTVLAFQGGGFVSGAVAHPGAPAKRVFTNGAQRALPAARADAERTFQAVIGGS